MERNCFAWPGSTEPWLEWLRIATIPLLRPYDRTGSPGLTGVPEECKPPGRFKCFRNVFYVNGSISVRRAVLQAHEVVETPFSAGPAIGQDVANPMLTTFADGRAPLVFRHRRTPPRRAG